MEESFHVLMRWFHYIAGVAWIGHLWFFNFVNANLQPTLDGETKKKVNPQLMPRALFLFRWGAMFTFLTGIAMLGLLWGDLGRWSGTQGLWMGTGSVFGTIMWFNVWFIIWPSQRKIIAGVKGDAPAAAPEIVKRATNASKVNTYLSVPMLMGMLTGAHGLPLLRIMNEGTDFAGWAVTIALGLGLVWLGYKFAPKISTNV